MLRTVAAAAAWTCVTDLLAVVVEINVGSVFFGAIAPAAETDDLVVFRPIGKRIVGGVDADEFATGADVGFEGSSDGLGPILAVVIADDDVVLGEIGVPGLPGLRELQFEFRGRFFCLGSLFGAEIPWDARSRRRCGGDLDAELAVALEMVPHDGCHGLPVVVVLAVDDQNSNRSGLKADLEEQEKRQAENQR